MEFRVIPWGLSCHRKWKFWGCFDRCGAWGMYNNQCISTNGAVQLRITIHISNLSPMIRKYLQMHIYQWYSTKLCIAENSIEFHWISSNSVLPHFDDTSSTMEFHGTSSGPTSLTGAVPLFHRKWEIRSTISRYGLFIINGPRSSAKQATSNFPFSMTREDPWNSTELLVPAELIHFKFPRNCIELLVSSKLGNFTSNFPI